LALDEQLNLLDGNMSAGLAVNQQTHLRDIRQRLWTSLDDGRSPWAHVERERLAALCAVRAAMASLAHFCCRAAAAENEGGGGVITGLEQLQLG
jgi:hypothetical protein